jgi:hypothetical protein
MIEKPAFYLELLLAVASLSFVLLAEQKNRPIEHAADFATSLL